MRAIPQFYVYVEYKDNVCKYRPKQICCKKLYDLSRIATLMEIPE